MSPNFKEIRFFGKIGFLIFWISHDFLADPKVLDRNLLSTNVALYHQRATRL
jgi:hypothetical protein